MGEERTSFNYEFTWSPELAKDFIDHAYETTGPLQAFRRYFWPIIVTLFFGCWLFATILAKQDVFPEENLSLVLKAIFAGYLVALTPVFVLYYLERTVRQSGPFDDLPVEIKCDETGCQSLLGKMTTFVPWHSVLYIVETKHGLILRMRQFGLIPIYDPQLREKPVHDGLLGQIDQWRKAAA